MARFPQTRCSRCGLELGPGDAGVSRCEDHRIPGIPSAQQIADAEHAAMDLQTALLLVLTHAVNLESSYRLTAEAALIKSGIARHELPEPKITPKLVTHVRFTGEF